MPRATGTSSAVRQRLPARVGVRVAGVSSFNLKFNVYGRGVANLRLPVSCTTGIRRRRPVQFEIELEIEVQLEVELQVAVELQVELLLQ